MSVVVQPPRVVVLRKAHGPNIKVSIVDSLLHEFLRKPIDERFQRAGLVQNGVTVFRESLQETRVRLRILRPSPEFTKTRVDVSRPQRTPASHVLHPHKTARLSLTIDKNRTQQPDKKPYPTAQQNLNGAPPLHLRPRLLFSHLRSSAILPHENRCRNSLAAVERDRYRGSIGTHVRLARQRISCGQQVGKGLPCRIRRGNWQHWPVWSALDFWLCSRHSGVSPVAMSRLMTRPSPKFRRRTVSANQLPTSVAALLIANLNRLARHPNRCRNTLWPLSLPRDPSSASTSRPDNQNHNRRPAAALRLGPPTRLLRPPRKIIPPRQTVQVTPP